MDVAAHHLQPVAVYGATGHTGQFVLRELRRRNLPVVAVARSFSDRFRAAYALEETACRQAHLDDPDALIQAFAGTGAVINCAGPFLDTADAIARASLHVQAHYLDISAEQKSTATTLAEYDAPARAAGVVVLPGMGFYGGFADLLVTALLQDQDHAAEVDIAIALSHWHPTRGTRLTGQRNTAQRLVLRQGQLVPLLPDAGTQTWAFPAPFGELQVTQLPFSETILLAQHLTIDRLSTFLNVEPLQDLRNPDTPPPQAADDGGRSAQTFVVEVHAKMSTGSRRVRASGQDIYAFTAPLVCEAAQRLLQSEGSLSGACAPGAIFDAAEFLHALTPDPLNLAYGPLE